MATPAQVTVVGQIMVDDEIPDMGAVVLFRRPVPSYHADGTVYEPIIERVVTASDGSFSIVLVTGTDPDWWPVNWAYTVTVKPSDGGAPWSFSTILEGSDGDTLTFGELNPMVSPPMPQLYALANHSHPVTPVVVPVGPLTAPKAMAH